MRSHRPGLAPIACKYGAMNDTTSFRFCRYRFSPSGTWVIRPRHFVARLRVTTSSSQILTMKEWLRHRGTSCSVSSSKSHRQVSGSSSFEVIANARDKTRPTDVWQNQLTVFLCREIYDDGL